MGYKRFRTFYDGVGGFFPGTDRLYRLTGEQLHVDRGSFWVGATYSKPDQPVFTFSYRDDIRTGSKDSTEWAAVVNPLAVVKKNALVGNALPANTPFINPNTQILDEHHRSVDAGVTAKLGRTTETFKFTYDWVNNVDSRDYIKYPNSLGVLADPTVEVTDDMESRLSRSVRLLDQTETTINDKFAVDIGLMYTHLNATNGGTWLTPTYAATPNAVWVADTAASIYGTSTLNDYTGNIFLKYTPTKDLAASLGFQRRDQRGRQQRRLHEHDARHRGQDGRRDQHQHGLRADLLALLHRPHRRRPRFRFSTLGIPDPLAVWERSMMSSTVAPSTGSTPMPPPR
jgi:hypothetical protein